MTADLKGADPYGDRPVSAVSGFADQYSNAADALDKASRALEAAVAAGDPTGLRFAGVYYDAARLVEARALTDLIRARRSQARPLLEILADPTMTCAADVAVLASIAEYAAAAPASVGLPVPMPGSKGCT